MLESDSAKNQKNDFHKSFALSIAVHSLVLSLFLIKFVFFNKPLIDLSQAISVNIEGDFAESKSAAVKDDNRLPPKIEEHASEPDVASIEKPSPPEDNKKASKEKKNDPPKSDAIDLKKAKSKQLAALKKLKKTSAIEKIKNDLKKERVTKIKNQLKQLGQVGSGKKVIAAGSSLGGIDKIDANNYLLVVDRSVKNNWTLPQWLLNKPLKAQLLLKISPAGEVLSIKVISSSGNKSYDNYCIQAVEKSAPFPKVPEKLTEVFSVDGIIVGFPD